MIILTVGIRRQIPNQNTVLRTDSYLNVDLKVKLFDVNQLNLINYSYGSVITIKKEYSKRPKSERPNTEQR